jgi:hypothetical protein
MEKTGFINPYRMFNGAIIPNWLLRRKELNSSEKLVYARLGQYAGKKGVAFPQKGSLAAEIGLSKDMVSKCLDKLADLRLIQTRERAVDGRPNQSNEYRFLDHEWIYENEDDEEELPGEGGGGTRVPPRGDPSTPSPRTPVPPRGDPGTRFVRESQEENQRRESEELAPPASGLAAQADQAQREFKNIENDPHKEEDAAEASPPLPVGANPFVEKALARTKEQSLARASAALAGVPSTPEMLKEEKKRRDKATRAQRQEEQARRERERGEEAKALERQQTPNGVIEKKWILETNKYFPEFATKKLVPREWGQIKHLLESYDIDQVEIAIEFLCMHWETVGKSILKGQSVNPMPSLGFLLSFRERVVPMALIWAKHRDTLLEFNAYSIDENEMRPAELEQRYAEARKELRALGL